MKRSKAADSYSAALRLLRVVRPCTALPIEFGCPPVVERAVHRHVPHKQRREETYAEYAEHDLPYDDEAVPKRAAYLVLQRLCQRRYLCDGGKREVDTCAELCKEGMRKPPGEFVLQDRCANGNTPDLESLNMSVS